VATERLGSNGKPLIERKKKNRLDTHRPLMEGFGQLFYLLSRHPWLTGFTRPGSLWGFSDALVSDKLKISANLIPKEKGPTWVTGPTPYFF